MGQWEVRGIKYTPQDLGILLNGKNHSDECSEKLQFSYQMTREGKAGALRISCPRCGFKMEFEGDTNLEINLEIKTKGKER